MKDTQKMKFFKDNINVIFQEEQNSPVSFIGEAVKSPEDIAAFDSWPDELVNSIVDKFLSSKRANKT